MMRINLAIYLIVCLFIEQIVTDYIISDELLLADDTESGVQLINLNKLKHSNSNNQFKLVNDTSLVNYVALVRDRENTLVVLKKKITYETLCDLLAENCVQNLKIVAVNENDFIELPIRIQRRQQAQPKKSIDNLLAPLRSKLKIKFNQNNLTFTAHLQQNQFTLDTASIILNEDIYLNKKQRKRLDQFNLEDLNSKIEYRVYSSDDNKLSELNLVVAKLNNTTNKLRLNVFFSSQQAFQAALNEKRIYNFVLEAYLPSASQPGELRARFGLVRNGSINVEIRLEEQEDLINDLNNDAFKPLDFEYPIYTSVLADNLNAHTVVLKPKLKELANSTQLVCSLIRNRKSNETQSADEYDDADLPFYVNDLNCSIMLKQNTYDLIQDLNKEETYSFSIKATYKNLTNSNNLLNYYYDYMIPALAKIEIKLRHEPARLPQVKYETILTRHELVTESPRSQLIILNINEPIEADSKLVKLIINEDELMRSNRRYQFEWLFNKSDEVFKFGKANKNLIVSNRMQLTDRSVYKTQVQVRERLKTSTGPVLKEIKLEFRVDYDPLIFENDEYNLLITETNILSENLIRVATVQTRHQQTSRSNIKYRILSSDNAASDANEYFQIDSNTGWVAVRKQLAERYYELIILASNLEQQKTASVKLKINVECYAHKREHEKTFKFSIYENLPNQTKIATLQTICPNLNLKYDISSLFTAKLCSRTLLNNQLFTNDDELSCNYFSLSNASSFVNLDSFNGNMFTNGFINASKFISSLQNDETAAYANDEDFKLKLNFNITATSLNGFVLNLAVDLAIQSAPKLLNFFENLALIEPNENLNFTSDDLLRATSCIYNYKYLIEKEFDSTDLVRFVRIDHNSAHLQAEFKQKVSECKTTSFLVNSNGCLALKTEEKLCANDTISPDLVLKSGVYDLEFKLCYYDSNKVSCSPFYNQHIFVEKDLFKTSRFLTNVFVSDNSNTLDDKSLATSGQVLLKSISGNMYVLVTLIVISLIILVVIISIVMKICKYYQNRKDYQKSTELKYGAQISKCLQVKNAETHSDSASNDSGVNINIHTETISNAATTSSKLSKTDDEVNISLENLNKLKTINFRYRQFTSIYK